MVTLSLSAGGGRHRVGGAGARGAALSGSARGAEPGATVTDVAVRFGVTRQTRASVVASVRGRRVWRGWRMGRRRRVSCPHQMAAVVEARIVELRRCASGVGSAHDRFIGSKREGWCRCRARSSIYRCLVRHGLIEPRGARRKKRRITSGGNGRGRWSCGRWTSLVGCRLVDGWKATIVSGVDDHSRFVISAHVVRASDGAAGVRRVDEGDAHLSGCRQQMLTDNGKVFTGRFGPGTGEVLFDRICRENGIKHISHRAAVADHDRQGRAVAQDVASRVLQRQGVRSIR